MAAGEKDKKDTGSRDGGTFSLKAPPRGLALLLLVGPSLIWVSEYIGSGEVIIATRTGAIFGVSVLWAVICGIFLKYWIGMAGARYTVTTGEGMIDLFARMPGPRNWAVWLIMVAQLAAAAVSIGSVASAAGAFLSRILPLKPYLAGWLVTVLAFVISWRGEFRWLKLTMSILVAIVIAGVLYVAIHAIPGAGSFAGSLIPHYPEPSGWAVDKGLAGNPWKEILPLLGWGAGGFASQVWYSYWVIGAGYGMAEKDSFGKSADRVRLAAVGEKEAGMIRGWTRMVTVDATLAMIIGIVATAGFLIAGAGILNPAQIVPDGPEVAIQLSSLFSSRWGEFGGFLFLLGGSAALISTQIGQLAGWPRLLSDTIRITFPMAEKKFSGKTRFRFLLILLSLASMTIIYTLGYKPVALVKFAAVFEGLLLTPLQALVVFTGLYFVMPRFFRPEIGRMLRPGWLIGAGLILAALFFGYFCIAELPSIL
ncbi:MAG: Nramp family divalent metal transporter [Bacteroidota bacterium]